MGPLNKIYSHPQISQEGMDRIIGAHKLVNYRKGEVLLKEGEVSGAYFCVASGLLRAFAIDLKGGDITTQFFTEGDIAIEVVSLFHQIPAKETIEALTDCDVWKISLSDFQQLFETVHGLADWGRTWMSAQLYTCRQRSIAIIAESAKMRYLALVKQKPEILRVAPLKHIATYLGITDTSLSRIRKEVLVQKP